MSEQEPRIPPAVVPTEEELIGELILDRGQRALVGGILKPEHFYSGKYALVYQAITELDTAGEEVTPFTISDLLQKQGHDLPASELIGIGSVLTGHGAEKHAKLIYEKHLYRRIIKIAAGLSNAAFNQVAAPASLMAQSIDKFNKLMLDDASANVKRRTGDIAIEIVQGFEAAQERADKLIGIPTGIEPFDDKLLGFAPGELVVLAARPGIGKTTLALQICTGAASAGYRTLFVTLEMSDNELVRRAVQQRVGVHSKRIIIGDFDSNYEAQCVHKALAELTPIFDVLQIRDCDYAAVRGAVSYEIAQAERAGKPYQQIIIDNLQNFTMEGVFKKAYEKYGVVTRGFKLYSQQKQIPVVLLCQLSRQYEANKKIERPRLSHLKDTGNTEQDADVVIFLHRENRTKQADGEDGKTEVIIAKNRNGAEGYCLADFNRQYCRFDFRRLKDED